MTIEEFKEKDKNFDSTLLISKVNNMLKKVYNAITLDELETVKHFLNDKVFSEFQEKYTEAIKNHSHLIYEEVNVNSEIDSIEEYNDFYDVHLIASIKYLEYYISDNGKIIKGNDRDRKEVRKKVTLTKKKNSGQKIIHRCLGCGMTLNINDNGKCPQCGRIYHLEEFDYIIKNIE